MDTYLIQLRGPVDLSEINPFSPHQMTSLGTAAAVTLLSICTDQSGMIGQLRHLNNLGFVILSVTRQAASPAESERKQS